MAWAVIYRIYVRSYQDSNNDGAGDLPGITQPLRYIASLNVDAIWITPFFPSPMKDVGYDVSDYSDIDPMFGTLEDFDRLIDRAHELGLKVVINQVISLSANTDAWFQKSRREQYYLNNFPRAQPDLNLYNPVVQDALMDTVRFWMSKAARTGLPVA